MLSANEYKSRSKNQGNSHDRTLGLPTLLCCIVLLAFNLLSVSCQSHSSENTSSTAGNNTIQSVANEDSTPKTIYPTGDPEKDWILVEQAVDAWLYFHLSDFKSYEPLIRRNDYDSIRDVYTHHLRFRMMNEEGGMVTLERDFEVNLNVSGENGNPFLVKEIPGL